MSIDVLVAYESLKLRGVERNHYRLPFNER